MRKFIKITKTIKYTALTALTVVSMTMPASALSITAKPCIDTIAEASTLSPVFWKGVPNFCHRRPGSEILRNKERKIKDLIQSLEGMGQSGLNHGKGILKTLPKPIKVPNVPKPKISIKF